MNEVTNERMIFKSHIFKPFKYSHYLFKRSFWGSLVVKTEEMAASRREVKNVCVTIQKHADVIYVQMWV